MLPPIKCQIFCFSSKFVLLTQLSRQQIQLSTTWLCHFLVYMGKYPHAEKLRISTEYILSKCVTDRKTYRQTDIHTDRQTDRQTD